MTAVARQVTPRPVFCVIDHLYRDLALADEVRAGRFTHAGIMLELGQEPDWLTSDLPADSEWRIEWSKFYYGLDLAYAFGATGDPGFLHAWERLVQSWIRQVPPDLDRSDVFARQIGARHRGVGGTEIDPDAVPCFTSHICFTQARFRPVRRWCDLS